MFRAVNGYGLITNEVQSTNSIVVFFCSSSSSRIFAQRMDTPCLDSSVIILINRTRSFRKRKLSYGKEEAYVFKGFNDSCSGFSAGRLQAY